MPSLTDPSRIRAVLETDRPWAVYALGDLAPTLFPHCSWLHVPSPTPALALLFRAFSTPVLFALGPAGVLQHLLDEIAREPELELSVRPDHLPLLETRYRVIARKSMWRMLLEPDNYHPVAAEGAICLGPDDLPALQALFDDGTPTGEAPDAFSASMLAEGVFFGVWEDDRLIAAAGTHLVVPQEGVAAVGNIYTRRDRRGLGLASRVTSAVTSELLRRGLRTVALNVNQTNQPAIRVYQRLGFARYCDFFEGRIVRRS
jgi:GNAT superfamily N-acetyltransferase